MKKRCTYFTAVALLGTGLLGCATLDVQAPERNTSPRINADIASQLSAVGQRPPAPVRLGAGDRFGNQIQDHLDLVLTTNNQDGTAESDQP